MKNFHLEKRPHLKSKESSGKMMFHLFLSLFLILIFSWYKNGISPFIKKDTDLLGMFHPILFVLSGGFTTYMIEVIYAWIFKKKKFLEAFIYSFENYSFFVGMFLGLILPINTPYMILLFGSAFGMIIGKLLFGGFGNNIFNPALVGYLFITSVYGTLIASKGGNLNPTELDAITKATPLTNVMSLDGIGTYKTLVSPYGSLWNFFVGTIPGALGETSALLCLLSYFYLSYKKVIKWKIPLAYIGTVFILTFMIGSFHNLGIWYPVFQILSGGLFFGAVFMATDPVTSPTTPIAQILYGLFLGILTVGIRFLTPYPEGVMLSILTMNLFVFLLDRIGSVARFHFKKAVIPFLLAWVMIIGLGIYLGVTLESTSTVDHNFKVISREIKGKKVTYVVTQKGYSSTLKGKIIFQNGKVTSFEMLEQSDSYYSRVDAENYLNKLVKEQENLENMDTVSGATISSTACKKMLINTIADYEEHGDEEILPEKEETPEKDFEVLDTRVEETNTIYTVSKKSFVGKIKAEITINEQGTITSINMLEWKDTYQEKVLEQNYLQTIIDNQDGISELDTVSGATISSTAIKNMAEETLKVHRGIVNEE